MAGQGVFSVTGVAAASAAYLAITPGKGGATARLLGDCMWKSATTAADLYQRFECGRMLSSATTTILLGAIDMMRYQLAGASEMYEEQRRREMATLEAEMYDILTRCRRCCHEGRG
ncbi:MAG UNVERIFIED_CONTAM: hypothetical protein LVR29_20555 [Microcystis novacekii LVE1205-3]